MDAFNYRDIKASGIRLRVTDVGEGPVLLLLHSTFLDRTCWNRVVPALSEHFRVVAPDLPGFGESEKPAPSRFAYDLNAFGHVVTDLFAALDLGQAHVVGHGLGGAIALALASQSRELVSRLVVVGSQCYPTSSHIAEKVAGLPIVSGLFFKQLLGKTLFRRYFRDVLVSQPSALSITEIDRYYESFSTPATRNSTVTTLRNTRDTRAVVAQLSRIAVPSLVIWGRDDSLHRAAFGRRLAKEISGAGFELLATGHLPQLEAPEQFSSVVANFCLHRRR